MKKPTSILLLLTTVSLSGIGLVSLQPWASAKEPVLASNQLDDGDITQPLGDLQPGKAPAFAELAYINGVNTSAESAVRAAIATGTKLGSPTRLIYNDLTSPIDAFSVSIEKVLGADFSVNEATDTLIDWIKTRVTSGKTVYIIGFSSGTIVINNAINYLNDDEWAHQSVIL